MPRQPKHKRPTQRSIAQEVGISVGAVSRALSDDPHISLETRERVQSIADQMGYVPDRAAQRLRTGRTNVIGLILSPHEELLGFGTSFVRGASEALDGSPYHLVVIPTFGTDATNSTVQRVVENGLADGILLSRAEPNDLRARYLIENNFPFVSHGRTELATPHPYVDFDNFAFAYQAVHDLATLGADHQLILMPPPHLTFHHHVAQGVSKAALETGATVHAIEDVTLDSRPNKICAAVKRCVDSVSEPIGLILPGDTSALAAVAACDDLGLIPGQDIHLTIKQSSGAFGFVRPRMPSVFEDVAAAAKTMADFLLKRIEGQDPEDLQFFQDCKESE